MFDSLLRWMSVCWVSLCWVSLCWVSLCWVSWRHLNWRHLTADIYWKVLLNFSWCLISFSLSLYLSLTHTLSLSLSLSLYLSLSLSPSLTFILSLCAFGLHRLISLSLTSKTFSQDFFNSLMDKLKLTGRNLGRVCKSRLSCVCLSHELYTFS